MAAERPPTEDDLQAPAAGVRRRRPGALPNSAGHPEDVRHGVLAVAVRADHGLPGSFEVREASLEGGALAAVPVMGEHVGTGHPGAPEDVGVPGAGAVVDHQDAESRISGSQVTHEFHETPPGLVCRDEDDHDDAATYRMSETPRSCPSLGPLTTSPLNHIVEEPPPSRL